MKQIDNSQLSLFDTIAEGSSINQDKETIQVAPIEQTKTAVPQWDEPFGLPIDIIGDEYLGGYLFKLSTFEAAAPIYTRPVFRVLLGALVDLRSQKKTWSQSSFTVFMGEFINYDSFYLGFGLGRSEAGGALLFSLRSKFEKIPAFQEFNSGSSEDCIPIYRYDKGFIVEYAEEELAGTSFIDGNDNYGSGQTIYRRGWQPADMHELIKSRYSKLK